MKSKKVSKAKRSQPSKSKHEIIVKVQQQSTALVPTVEELIEPIHDGSKLAIAKTWVSERQIMRMVQQTPKQHVYTRPAKGGGQWPYVTGSYVEKVLNFTFGFLWDFEVVQHGKEGDQVWVLGKLTVKDAKGNTITKTQFGRADIKFKKDTKIMLDFGNDLKGATTDSLKKCASLLGIASDIYGKADYKQETGRDPREPQKPQAPIAPKQDASRKVVAEEQPPVEAICHGATKSGCGNELTQQEFDYSKRLYGKPLCRECQKLAPRK